MVDSNPQREALLSPMFTKSFISPKTAAMGPGRLQGAFQVVPPVLERLFAGRQAESLGFDAEVHVVGCEEQPGRPLTERFESILLAQHVK